MGVHSCTGPFTPSRAGYIRPMFLTTEKRLFRSFGESGKTTTNPPIKGVVIHTMEVTMPGASKETRRVKILNANWFPGIDDGEGRFELLIITEDDQQYAVPADPVSMTALVALARADTVLAWDPTNRVLIVANIVGTMPWTAAPTA